MWGGWFFFFFVLFLFGLGFFCELSFRLFGVLLVFFAFIITVNSMPCPIRVVLECHMESDSISQNDRSVSHEFSES